MDSPTPKPGSWKGGVLNLMVEVKVSKPSLLVSRLMLIMDLAVLAFLLFFSLYDNKSKHIKLLRIT